MVSVSPMARLARGLRGFRRLRGWERVVSAIAPPPKEATPFVVKNRTGYFAGDLSSLIDRRMYMYGQYEADMIELFVSRIPSGRRRIILDVGANVGTHSLAFAQKFASVHSFEPNPALWENFAENVRLNGLENVTLHKIGLADKIGEIPFFNIQNKNAGLGTCSPDELYDKPLERAGSVQVVTGDGFAAGEGLHSVDAIKIDVQGFELEVVRGLQEVLSRDRPFVWLEVGGSTARGVDSVAALKALFPFPSDIFRFDSFRAGLLNAVRLTPVIEGDLQYADYLVSPAGAAN